MKHRGLRGFWVAVLVLGLAVFACAQPKKLTILHANDTHSAMVPFETGSIPAVGPDPELPPGVGAGLWNVWHFPFNRDYAGIARMATLIKALRAKDPNVLALHAGDVFVGSFEFNKSFGYPELKIMENLYDVMELGNHEFDLGLEALAGVLSGQLADGAPVNLDVLCANLDFAGTAFGPGGPLAGMIQPSVIKTVGGIKVGIFGLITQEPQVYSSDVYARFHYPYEDADPTKTLWYYAGQLAGGLKQQGCEVVVCLSHIGTGLDVLALSQVPYIDVIVGGHSHDVYSEANVVIRGDGSQVIIVHAGEFGKYLGELKLVVDNGAVGLESWTPIRVDGQIKEDPKVRAIVNTVRSSVVADPRFGQVYTARVAWALRDISKDWPATGPNRDTPLGNMITDAFRDRLAKARFQVDCALDVLGYEGSDIYAGKVVGNNILRAVPYGYDQATGLDFKVVIVPLPGELLIGGLEYAAGLVTQTTDLAVQASGLTYTYNSKNDPGSRVNPSSVFVGDEPVAANLGKVYYVAMSDQVFGFLNALVGGQLPSIPTGLNEYTIVRDYMKALKFVRYQSVGRIKDTAGL